MIVTGSIIGVISFGVQAYNSWSNEKNAKKMREAQETFQRAALEQNLDEAKRQYEMMLAARREFMHEERSNQLDIMHKQHIENLHSIEYLASLDKWPLAVLPLVMRDDNLFFELPEETTIVPISIILGPCRDRSFQLKIWKRVEDEIAMRFAAYWNGTSSHPIVFYQDAWKDDHEQADSTQCANIHAKIPYTPTIIISPIIGKKGLQLEMTHWCVDSADSKSSFKKEVRVSLAESYHNYQRDEEYDEDSIPGYVGELSEIIEGLIGYLDDQYMWLRYSVLPQFPLVLKQRISIDEKGRDLLYRQYVEMLKSSLTNGHVNIVSDIKLVLAYCLLVDDFGQRHDAFDMAIRMFYGKNLLTDIRYHTPAYEVDKLVYLLKFCKENQTVVGFLPVPFHNMRCGASLVKLNDDSQTRLINEGCYQSNDKAKIFVLENDIYETFCEEFQVKCEQEFKVLLDLCRNNTNGTLKNKRDWCYPRFMEKLRALFSEVIEKILDIIDDRAACYIEQIARNAMESSWEQQKDDSLLGVVDDRGDAMSPDEIKQLTQSAEKSVCEYAKTKAVKVQHDFWKNTYLKSSVDKKLDSYCNITLKGWIEYFLFSEDVIKESLSEAEKKAINERMTAIRAMIKAIGDNYIDLLFVKHEN